MLLGFEQENDFETGAVKALYSFWHFLDFIKFKGGTKNFSQVHKELADFISEPQIRCTGSFSRGSINTNYGRRRLVLLPRGHLKSTLCSVGYVLWRIYRNPNIRICVATATKDLAFAFIREVKQYFENEDLQERFWNKRPHIPGRLVPVLDKTAAKRRDRLREDETEALDKKVIWRTDALQVLRSDLLKEPTLVAASPGGNVTGMHFDLIIKDDIINDDSTSTSDKMEKTLEWAMDLESVLDPQRKVSLWAKRRGRYPELWEIVGDEDLVLGTRYARGDYYEYILDNLNHLKYKTFVRNIYKNGVNNTEGYLWPERFNDFIVDNLKRRQSPRRFASQYLNQIIADEDQIFKVDVMKIIDPMWFEIKDNKCRITFPNQPAVDVFLCLVVDPAISQKKDADNSVLMVGGFDADRNLYLLDCRFGKMLPETLIAKMYELVEKWKLSRVTIEVVAFQQVLVHMIRSAFARFRPIGINEYRPRGEKKARIASMLEPYFANHKIYVAKPLIGIPKFREEIEYFSTNPNSSVSDDFIDCAAIIAEIGVPAPSTQTKPIRRRGLLPNLGINQVYGGIY